jgi:hypothetical protein
MIRTVLPTPTQLRAAPQLSALVILDAALVTAEEVLLALHPALDSAFLAERGPPDDALVPVLIARFDELHHLLGRYHAAVRASLLAPPDDFPF